MKKLKEQMIFGILTLLEKTKKAENFEVLNSIALEFNTLYSRVANPKNNRKSKFVTAWSFYAKNSEETKGRNSTKILQKTLKNSYAKKESYRECVDEISELRARGNSWNFIQTELQRRHKFKKIVKAETIAKFYNKREKNDK